MQLYITYVVLYFCFVLNVHVVCFSKYIMSEDHYSLLCSFLTGILGVTELSDTIKQNMKSMLTYYLCYV